MAVGSMVMMMPTIRRHCEYGVLRKSCVIRLIGGARSAKCSIEPISILPIASYTTLERLTAS